MRKNRVKVDEWTQTFLGELMRGASIERAAKVAGIHWTRPYQLRRDDKAFAAAWRECAQIGSELLVEEACRRAYYGVLKPILYKGQRVAYERRYSDTLLMFLIKQRDPSYREAGSTVVVNNNTLNVFDDITNDARIISGEVDGISSTSTPPHGNISTHQHSDNSSSGHIDTPSHQQSDISALPGTSTSQPTNLCSDEDILP